MPRSATFLPSRTESTTSTHAVAMTRRGILRHWGMLLTSVLLTIQSGDVKAKRKKKKDKKSRSAALKPTDWNGFWNTRLSNGVSGTLTLSYDTNFVYGSYSNSVGSGVLRCYADASDPFDCFGRYDQTDGSAGNISMTLQDAEHWYGTYQIDGGGSGTWSGVR